MHYPITSTSSHQRSQPLSKFGSSLKSSSRSIREDLKLDRIALCLDTSRSFHFSPILLASSSKLYPKVRAIEQEEALNKLEVEAGNFLILDIPLNLRRVTILEQINKLLDEHHDGKNLDVRSQSTALVQLETTKLQHKTIPILVDVAEILYRNPDIQLYQLAQRAKLAEIHLGRKVQETNSPEQEKQRRQMAASRYKEQAERLVYNAARLKFPSID